MPTMPNRSPRSLTALFSSTLFASLLCTSAPVNADSRILPMRERAGVVDTWLTERIDTVLPMLMQRTGIDFWLITAREYNEDPVIRTMLPATWLSARRRTMLVVYKDPDSVSLETLAVARYDVGSQFKRAWDKETQPDQWQRLVELIAQRDPAKIGVNISSRSALADGLSYGEYQGLIDALPEQYADRLVSAENLAIGWLETRTPSEMVVYQQICRIAHEIIAEGFSEQVIQPGVTSTDDVVWWYRERIRERKLVAWFHPSVTIQRAEQASTDHKTEVLTRTGNPEIIQPGDLLHVDFGVTYLRLNTDTQQHAYVLKAGESQAPDALRQAFAKGHRLQDILTGQFVAGRSGNDILARTLKQAAAENIDASIYTHPIGYHGHGAGPTIGLWDQQGGVPGRGDYPLYPNTAHSIELYAASFIPEWQRDIRIKLEEDAFFDGTDTRYIDGRQTELILIPRPPAALSAKIAP
jgi:Xaa-Pro aminopeptidase